MLPVLSLSTIEAAAVAVMQGIKGSGREGSLGVVKAKATASAAGVVREPRAEATAAEAAAKRREQTDHARQARRFDLDACCGCGWPVPPKARRIKSEWHSRIEGGVKPVGVYLKLCLLQRGG